MQTILISRDIAESLENQFYPSIKEIFEDECSCEAVEISGTVIDSLKIDYQKIENDLINNWSYSEMEAKEIVANTRILFSNTLGSFDVKWEA